MNMQSESKVMFGGEAIAEMLKIHDVGPMMGMGGFQLLPMYEAFRRLGMKHYLVNDERAAVFAMDAYSRVTGKPGVCDATLGPGATNLVTGLVESLNASIPLVVIVGDTNRDYSFKNMTQETSQVEILRPAVKELIRVEKVHRIPELIRRAFFVATSGRPGPVILDVPEDICHEEYDFDGNDFWADSSTTGSVPRRCRPDPGDINRATEMLIKAKRPIILAGGGIHISHAYESLQILAEINNIPVCHTISGKGSISCFHPLSAGLFGRYSRIANDLIVSSDLIIVIGCKLGEIATKRFQIIPPKVPVIHLDILPEEFGRTTPADIYLFGDALLGINDLITAVTKYVKTSQIDRTEYVAEIKARMKVWRTEASGKLYSNEKPINIARMITEINKVMPENSILVADGGFAGHWAGLLYDTKKHGRTFIANRGFASIGYGLPASLGAKLGAPQDVPVVGITGDAGFNMMLGELETARRLELPFTIIVVNNGASGYVKALQHLMYGKDTYQSSDLSEMNYAKIAQSMGCKGIRIEDPDNLQEALKDAISNTNGPVVIDIVVTRDPANMLPAIDNRTVKITKGDRVA